MEILTILQPCGVEWKFSESFGASGALDFERIHRPPKPVTGDPPSSGKSSLPWSLADRRFLGQAGQGWSIGAFSTLAAGELAIPKSSTTDPPPPKISAVFLKNVQAFSI